MVADLRSIRTTRGILCLVATMVWTPLAAAGQNEEASDQVTLKILDGRDRSISAYPFAYYTPETELAIGAGGIVTYYTSRFDPLLRPSKTSISGYYSTRGQYSFSQATDIFFNENTLLISVPFSFGSFVDKYWGPGNLTEDITNVDYDVQILEGSVVVEGATFLEGFARDGIVYRGSYVDIKDVKENPNLGESVTGVEGGFTSGLGVDLVVDTRDAVFYPTEGAYSRLVFLWYAQLFGSEYRFSRIEADVRRYVSVGEDQIVAFHALGDMVFGDAPFYELPALGGGSIMRGYYQGRFRDVNLLAAQVEYRRHLFWRLGSVLFAGLGEAFGGDQSDLSFSDLKYSVGGGLRFLFDPAQRINLRMDIGWGRGSSGVYFGLEEAF